MRSREVIWSQLIDLVTKIDTVVPKNLFKKIEFSDNTELVADLGLTGDDATQFMDSFAETFAIKSGDYQASNYFSNEGLWLLSFKKPKPKKPITLGMLLVAAQLGTWDTARLNKVFLDNRACK